METLKEQFEEQKQQKDVFNIFKVLHDETDERRLHSRFISYLLSSNKEFLKLFIHKILSISDFGTSDSIVRPNREKKSEYENIDILIYNDKNKQAIIIENKIFAGDCNRQGDNKKYDGYDGQLECYYNTITTGINKETKPIDIGEKKVLKVVYLTLDRHEPSADSRGKSKPVPDEKIKLIDYTQDISKWLDECIAKTSETESDLRSSICQYKKLVQDLTSDVEQAKKNQKLLSENIEKAWKLQDKEHEYFTKECFELFKHVQWHTIDDFFNELEEELRILGADEIQKPQIENITKVAHHKNNNSNTKLVMTFKYDNCDLYIANDRLGLTLGYRGQKKWTFVLDKLGKLKNIRFYDFSREETFRIINNCYRKEAINDIIELLKRLQSDTIIWYD